MGESASGACGEAIRGAVALAGTPVHVYDAAVIAARYGALDAAFAGVRHRIHYALKANSTTALVRRIRELGAHADVNSAGELEVARRAGFPASAIVLTGVGKTGDELEAAVGLGVHAINVESPGEVARIEAIARRLGRVARIALRINPDVDAESHPHIATGRAIDKFGMPIDAARALAKTIASWPALRLVGVHLHIGSQITTAAPFARAAATLASFALELRTAGAPLEHIDVGGGLGVRYRAGDPVLPLDEYARAVLPAVRDLGLTVVLEPGRWLVAPAGVLLTRVVDLKEQSHGRRIVVVDAGMTELIRPALYGAWHEIEAASPRDGARTPCDVVGPVCETGDTLGRDRLLPPLEVGDVLIVRDTGAYGAVMASNYNRRPMAAEVLVDAGECRVIRRRQTIDDLLQWDA